MAEIFITGATGNIGAEVVRLLSRSGIAARAGVLPAEAPGYHPPVGVEAAAFDFERAGTYAPALSGVRRVFLMRPPNVSDVRRQMFPFIDAMRQNGVDQVVFLSLLGADGNRIVPHRKVEDYLQASGIPYTFLRPSFFMQNLSTTHRPEIQRGEICVPAGRGRTSFIDTRDIAAAAVKTLTEAGHLGQAYALTGSQALDYDEVAAIFTRILGRKISYTKPSLLRFALYMRRERRLTWAYILVMLGIYTTAALGKAAQVTEDTPRLLGRDPITMEQFVRDYCEVWG